MTEELPDELPLSERDTRILSDFDEAQRHGGASSAWDPIDAAAEFDLAKPLACLRMLERVFPRKGLSPSATDDHAGQKVGRFVIQRLLGYGGCGVVYLAEDTLLQRHVALKIPHAPNLIDPRQRERFVREARSTAALNHPNLVPLYDAAETDGVCHLVVEYCAGPTLAQWLQRTPSASGDAPAAPSLASRFVDPFVAAEIVYQLSQAVEHAHSKGILHRDLKPGNVMLDVTRRCGSLPFTPRLTDFGLAHIHDLDDESQASTTGAVAGTPQYMAPEQAASDRRLYGPATDVYGLGAVLYEMLTGRPPVAAGHLAQVLLDILSKSPEAPRRINRDVPRSLEAICLKCLENDPQRRYASAALLADDLDRFLQRRPVRARPHGPLNHFFAWCRHPARIALAGASTSIAGAIAMVWCLIMLAGIFLQIVAIPRPLEALAHGVVMIAIVYAPLCWLGRKISQRRAWAMWTTLAICSANWAAVMLSLSLTYNPEMGGLGDGAAGARWGVEVIICLLYTYLIFVNAVALVAWYANRRLFRPWFVPAASATPLRAT